MSAALTAWRVQAATILGADHETTTGVLRRADATTGSLTGAFGAWRDE